MPLMFNKSKHSVEDAVKQGILPVAILGAFVSGHMATQGQPVEEQGQRQQRTGPL